MSGLTGAAAFGDLLRGATCRYLERSAAELAVEQTGDAKEFIGFAVDELLAVEANFHARHSTRLNPAVEPGGVRRL